MKYEKKKIQGSSQSIDTNGDVWSARGFKLRTQKSKGYRRISIWNGGKSKNYRVHRLVAIAFIPNERDPFFFGQVDHIDGDRSNNHVSNLRWVSHKENMNYKLMRKVDVIVSKELLNKKRK